MSTSQPGVMAVCLVIGNPLQPTSGFWRYIGEFTFDHTTDIARNGLLYLHAGPPLDPQAATIATEAPPDDLV